MKKFAVLLRNSFEAIRDPSWKTEAVLWFLVFMAVACSRIFLYHLLPTYIWSSDSKSYLKSVVDLFDQGQWHTQERRGPVYSAFVAAAVSGSRHLASLVVLQHVLGALGVLAAAFLLRVWVGKRAMLPVAFCAICYGIYSLPIYLEHLVRNEALLFFFASAALVALGVGLRSGSLLWLAVAGFSGAALSATKNIFVPFPIIVPVAICFLRWGKWRSALLQAAVFIVAFVTPLLALRIYYAMATEDDAPTSYAGVQLYGRVAQFTYLDGGIEPELKAHIAPLVKEYRSRSKLDNNWVIKRGIVPEIAVFMDASAKEKDLSVIDPVCRALAFEAIRTHPGPYARQVQSDLGKLLFKTGFEEDVPEAGSLDKLRLQLKKMPDAHAILHRDETVKMYADRNSEGHFEPFYKLTRKAVIFEVWPPLLVTSLLIPILFFVTPRDQRAFWLVGAALWYFNLILLSTVGKPLHRYMVPFAPLMFLAMGSALSLIWMRLMDLAEALVGRYQVPAEPTSEASR